jgi:hypothetical protein
MSPSRARSRDMWATAPRGVPANASAVSGPRIGDIRSRISRSRRALYTVGATPSLSISPSQASSASSAGRAGDVEGTVSFCTRSTRSRPGNDTRSAWMDAMSSTRAPSSWVSRSTTRRVRKSGA